MWEMSELRDRVVEAIRSSQTLVYRNEWELIADAVIAALGLREEWGALDEQDGGFLADTREELTVGRGETLKHRYITEWEPTE